MTSSARFAGDDPFLAQEAQVAGDGIGAAEPEFGGNLLGDGHEAAHLLVFQEEINNL